jgi:membrane-bound lytic murein transglycosylase B
MIILSFTVTFYLPPSVAAPFEALQQELWPAAEKAGVRRDVFNSAFAGLTPDREVLRLAERQPEFELSARQYLARLVTSKRLAAGKAAFHANARLLAAIERRYGVNRFVLLAIWGIETNYGVEQGSKNVIRSLATLAASGKRTGFAKTQLIEALKILQRGDVSLENMAGSWAGAMGHTQFIPSTYNRYAVDFNGDGKRDIWMSAADALASAANYLKRSGWRTGRTWGYAVVTRAGFQTKPRETTIPIRIRSWQRLGIARKNFSRFPKLSDRARLLSLGGDESAAFLTIANFEVIKKYNRSDLYALAVGQLADQLATELASQKRLR